MKIGRNDLCPCGSGKKYKQCCLRKDTMTEYDLIREVVAQEGYEPLAADFICNLFHYMNEKQWSGACHATCSILFVGFSELGYSPQIYIGEAAILTRPRFDHSWITINNKVIDLAVAMPLPGHTPISSPIIFDINIGTKQKHEMIYGVKGGKLDYQANFAFNTPFVDYMDMYPNDENGLWGILKRVFPKDINIENIKSKYVNVQRVLVN